MQKKKLLLIIFTLFSTYLCVGCGHSRYGFLTSFGFKNLSMDHFFSNFFLEESMIKDVAPPHLVKSRMQNKDDPYHVHFCDQGEGPVLLLLHGFTASLHTWNGWVDALKDKYRIIRLDILGFGLTGPSKTKTYSRDDWVKFIDNFVKSINVDKFSIAGNSLGGYIAWNYALDYPQKVDKLILIDPIGYPQDAPFLLDLACFPVVGEMGKLMMPRLIVKMCLKDVYGDKTLVTEELVDLYFALASRPGAREAYIDIFRMMKAASTRPDIGDRIKYISRPTMIMWGESDRWVPIKLLDRWTQDVPHAVVRRYPGMGHIPMEENPSITAVDADRFLSNQFFASKPNQHTKE
jgi:pimeloyl-ACP methyl ester carboxylesterase